MIPIEKILNRINVLNNGCWEWVGAKSSAGYGQIRFNWKTYYTHRLLYEYYYGKIHSNLSIDHLCRNRICCNPEHLEEVSLRINLLRGVGVSAKNARKTHCKRGHKFSNPNLIIRPNGDRECRMCINQSKRNSYYKNRVEINLKRKLKHQQKKMLLC